MKFSIFVRSVLVFSCLSVAGLAAEDVLQLKDGDRVVLVGSTIVEREQSYGYWEAALSAANPGVEFSLRNLGWSGDTVWADSRAGFENAEYGFKELQRLVETLKPSVAVVAYGFNESFAGEEGLPKFLEGLKRLTEMLAGAGARIVLVSPTRMENRVGKFPDHTANNQRIELYREAIRKFAGEMQYGFGDWTENVIPAGGSGPLTDDLALTDNGLHLTEKGYWKTSGTLASLSGGSAEPPEVVIDVTAKKIEGGVVAEKAEWTSNGVKFQGTVQQLPQVNFQDLIGARLMNRQVVKVNGLSAGTTYQMLIDGMPAAKGTGAEWALGVALTEDPGAKQAEEMRQAIRLKNELFFHRWRPQNVTYLFGFRKHEQGQNAKEVAEFEPLVQEQDRLINELKKPRSHTYELVVVK